MYLKSTGSRETNVTKVEQGRSLIVQSNTLHRSTLCKLTVNFNHSGFYKPGCPNQRLSLRAQRWAPRNIRTSVENFEAYAEELQ